MAIEFLLPDLGEGIHEAEIQVIMVKEGDMVKEDQPIFEVETDKAVVQIPCPVTGKVEKIPVSAGQVVKVGMVMMTFSTAGGAAPAPESKPAAKEAGAAAAPAARPLAAVANQVASARSDNGKGTMHAPGRPVPAAPATRRLARELGVDLHQVCPSGPAGRVMKEDVRNHAAGTLEQSISAKPADKGSVAARAAQPATPPVSIAAKYGESAGGKSEPFTVPSSTSEPIDLPDFSKFGPVERIPLKSIRRKIAQNMALSWSRIPHVTTMDEAEISALEAFIAKHAPKMKERGARLTLTVFALKAIASGLKKYPQFNASLDERSGELVFKHYYNLGVAVATERGLIVPVIKNVDQKSIVDLSIELADIAEKTRSGKIELERLQGGTFTLTNIGAIGGTGSTPMINFPECAILGLAKAAKKPVVRDDKIEIGTILPLTLSFDHRIADGAEAAYFVQHIVQRLQDPLTFLLDI
jgi:pyruvate dehydrogenase E2 component (dihydrolipoamide acetyltransferase)